MGIALAVCLLFSVPVHTLHHDDGRSGPVAAAAAAAAVPFQRTFLKCGLLRKNHSVAVSANFVVRTQNSVFQCNGSVHYQLHTSLGRNLTKVLSHSHKNWSNAGPKPFTISQHLASSQILQLYTLYATSTTFQDCKPFTRSICNLAADGDGDSQIGRQAQHGKLDRARGHPLSPGPRSVASVAGRLRAARRLALQMQCLSLPSTSTW